ncbi:MAG: oligosaccharide flippase family protein [Pirellulales bacterium]
MAEQVALGDNEAVNRFFTTSLVTFALISLVVSAVLIVFAVPIVRVCQIDPDQFHDAVFLVRVFSSVMVTLALLQPAWESVLFGHSRFDLSDFAMIVEYLLRAGGVIAVLTWTDWGVLGWCGAVLFSRSASVLLTGVFAHLYHKGLKARRRYVDGPTLRELLSLGGVVSLRQTAARLSMTVEPLIVSSFLGTVGVSFYNPAVRMVNAPWPFIIAVARQFTPMATGRHTTGDQRGLQEILFRGTRLMFSIATLPTVLLIAFAHPIVEVYLGPGREVTAWVLVVSSIGQLVQYSIGSQWQVMLGKNDVRVMSIWQIAAATVSIVASVGLAMGAMAWVAPPNQMMACLIAVVAPAIVIRTVERVVVGAYVAHHCGSSARAYFVEAYWGPILVMVICLAVSLLLRWQWVLDSWLALIAAATVVSAFWCLGTWFFVFDETDRNRAMAVFHRRRPVSGANNSPSD